MAVIDLVRNGVTQGQYDTEDKASAEAANAVIRSAALDHNIVRAIDETGLSRPVATVDDIKETDRRVEMIRPSML